ncbi:MAG: HD domain-containing protein [Candidatus Omnitrophica bacterium]|nr:HD domain-containing protein [Candidatus Omnitrophota bacterium]HOX54140.1 HD domain-containing protein [Candidatus Omnitrophota bacterium]
MDPLVNKLLNNPFLRIIQKKSKKHKIPIFLVGGYLRDLILGREKSEFDLDFTLKKYSIKIAKEIARELKAGFVILDKERGCARVVYNKNGKVFTLDFADFRDKNLERDLLLRDFTINSLAADVNNISVKKNLRQIIIDPYQGIIDLKKGVIKMTSKDSFKDDPLRIVRAFSLAGILDFKLEPQTLNKIKKEKDKIPTVAYERIRDEFFKVLELDNSIKHLKLMDKNRVLEKIIPHINVMRNVKQGGYHHLDVWNHTLETVLQLERIFEESQDSPDIKNYLNEDIVLKRSRKSLMKLGALLHDIGKPKAKMQKDGKTLFYGHERIGKEITENIAGLLKLSTKEKDALEKMIFWHLRPGYLAETKMPTERAIFRYFRDTADEGVSILLLSLADQRATRGPLTDPIQRRRHEKLIKELVQRYFDKLKEKPFVRLIDGNDLIKKLRLKPSPDFSKILREVEEAQAEGSIKTKNQALELAKKIARKLK